LPELTDEILPHFPLLQVPQLELSLFVLQLAGPNIPGSSENEKFLCGPTLLEHL
jgi:hypothetical protein